MTTSEQLQDCADMPYAIYGKDLTRVCLQAKAEIEALQKENADLRKQIAELTVKKTQVYNPPKPSIGNFSS